MTAHRVIKIFCTRKQQQQIIKKWTLSHDACIEYPGFLVLHLGT